MQPLGLPTGRLTTARWVRGGITAGCREGWVCVGPGRDAHQAEQGPISSPRPGWGSPAWRGGQEAHRQLQELPSIQTPIGQRSRDHHTGSRSPGNALRPTKAAGRAPPSHQGSLRVSRGTWHEPSPSGNNWPGRQWNTSDFKPFTELTKWVPRSGQSAERTRATPSRRRAAVTQRGQRGPCRGRHVVGPGRVPRGWGHAFGWDTSSSPGRRLQGRRGQVASQDRRLLARRRLRSTWSRPTPVQAAPPAGLGTRAGVRGAPRNRPPAPAPAPGPGSAPTLGSEPDRRDAAEVPRGCSLEPSGRVAVQPPHRGVPFRLCSSAGSRSSRARACRAPALCAASVATMSICA